jgi:hypothetical protein
MQRLKLLCCLMLASCLLPVVALAGPAKVTLVTDSGDTFLTDTARMQPAQDSKAGSLNLSGKQVSLSGDSYAVSVGRRVAVVTRTARETSVQLFDADGSTIRQTSVAPGRKVLPFGQAVAVYEPSLHEPGVPYSVDVMSSQGTTRVEKPGRLIHDIFALEDHVVISSVDADAGTVDTDVIDGAGQIRWSFSRSGRSNPRVAVQGNRAVAVYADRPESAVEVSELGGGVARLAIPGLMSNVAFLSDGSAILAWGSHTTTLLDIGAQRVLWQQTLPASGKPYPTQLNGVTSLVTPIAGTVAMVAREQSADGAWDVQLVFFDVGSGSIAETRALYRDAQPPTLVRRFEADAKERLVLPHRVYEIEAQR